MPKAAAVAVAAAVQGDAEGSTAALAAATRVLAGWADGKSPRPAGMRAVSASRQLAEVGPSQLLSSLALAPQIHRPRSVSAAPALLPHAPAAAAGRSSPPCDCATPTVLANLHASNGA